MARKKMVTRTFKETTATIMCLNVLTAEVLVIDYTIGRDFQNDADCLAAFKEIEETGTFKLVHVENRTVKDVLIGMSEEDFFRYGTVLPPRSGSVDDTEE